MKTVKHFIILAFIILAYQQRICAQANYTDIYPNYRVPIEYEKINVNTFSNKYKGSILDYTYKKDDGTTVEVKSYKRGSNIEIFERPPFPAIHIIYKEFHPNGNLKQKGVLLPLQLRIGKWLDLDQRGEGTITDYENGRTALGYNDVLAYLESKAFYNKSDENSWKCTFWYTPESQTWGVRVDKNGNQYKMYTFDSNRQNGATETDLSENSKSASPVGTFYQEE
ncbi:MAG: hypothetical protein ACK5KT_15760 [Dysgonomonas sp.]